MEMKSRIIDINDIEMPIANVENHKSIVDCMRLNI